MLWHKAIGAGGVAGGPASYTNASSGFTNTNTTNPTFTVTSLDAAADYWVVLWYSGASGSGNLFSAFTITLDGVSPSDVIADSGSDAIHTAVLIFAANGSTSGTLSVGGSSTLNRSGYFAYNVFDLESATATDEAGDYNGGDPLTASIDIEPGGICFAIGSHVSSSSFTWTGLTERATLSFEHNATAADDAFLAGDTARTIELDVAASNSEFSRMSVAAFR